MLTIFKTFLALTIVFASVSTATIVEIDTKTSDVEDGGITVSFCHTLDFLISKLDLQSIRLSPDLRLCACETTTIPFRSLIL